MCIPEFRSNGIKNQCRRPSLLPMAAKNLPFKNTPLSPPLNSTDQHITCQHCCLPYPPLNSPHIYSTHACSIERPNGIKIRTREKEVCSFRKIRRSTREEDIALKRRRHRRRIRKERGCGKLSPPVKKYVLQGETRF